MRPAWIWRTVTENAERRPSKPESDRSSAGPRLHDSAARVDERDVIFSRMARVPGNTAYDDYYSRRPDLKKVDDRLRSMPVLCRPGGRYFDAAICAETERWFGEIGRVAVYRAPVEEAASKIRAAADATAAIKQLALELGAVAVGCADVEQSHLYTCKGRFDRDYGDTVTIDHPAALVFLVEMEFETMQRAPAAEVLCESARQYYRAALVSKTIEAVLVRCGYEAKAQYDAHYDLLLPPMAVRAGLGELGRNNILVADRYGSRVRIGAVTTDFPLVKDEPVLLGVDRFCQSCLKCADNCPARAISSGPKEEVRGVMKWPTRAEQCYAYWRRAGTDCGICMAVCPFSHRNTGFHNSVRRLLQLAPALSPVALFLDDLVYGRRWASARAYRGGAVEILTPGGGSNPEWPDESEASKDGTG
jgi:reductive dehalogenase